MPRTIHQLIEKLQQSNPKLRLEVLKELDRRCHGSSDVQSEVARYGGLDEMWRELRRATRAVENKLCALKIISHFSTHAQLRDVLIQPETLRELEKSLQHPSDQIKAAVLQVYADLSFRNEQSQALLIEAGLATTLLEMITESGRANEDYQRKTVGVLRNLILCVKRHRSLDLCDMHTKIEQFMLENKDGEARQGCLSIIKTIEASRDYKPVNSSTNNKEESKPKAKPSCATQDKNTRRIGRPDMSMWIQAAEEKEQSEPRTQAKSIKTPPTQPLDDKAVQPSPVLASPRTPAPQATTARLSSIAFQEANVMIHNRYMRAFHDPSLTFFKQAWERCKQKELEKPSLSNSTFG